jgi:hypothetical protein
VRTKRNILVASTLLAVGCVDIHLAMAEEQQSLDPVTINGRRETDWSFLLEGGGNSGEASLCKNGGDFDRADACGESNEQFAWLWPWETQPCADVKVDKISASTLKKDGEAAVEVQNLMGWVGTDPVDGKLIIGSDVRASALNTVQRLLKAAVQEGVPLSRTDIEGAKATYNLEITEGDVTVFVRVRYDAQKEQVILPGDKPKNAIEPSRNTDSKQTNAAKEKALNCSTSATKSA